MVLESFHWEMTRVVAEVFGKFSRDRTPEIDRSGQFLGGKLKGHLTVGPPEMPDRHVIDFLQRSSAFI